jgi:hypothetical protein
MRLVALVIAIAVFAGCAAPADVPDAGAESPDTGPIDRLGCRPRTVVVTGSLAQDVLGTWDRFGIDSRVVGTFYPDGGFLYTEEPNLYAPHGGSSLSAWTVDGGVLFFGPPGGPLNGSSASVDMEALTWSGWRHPAMQCPGL